MSHDACEVRFQHIECCIVRFWTSTDDDIRWRSCRQQACTNKLAQASLESITVHGGFRITWHNDSNTCMSERGSKYPNVEMLRSDSLPLSRNFLDLRTTREPVAPRKGEP